MKDIEKVRELCNRRGLDGILILSRKCLRWRVPPEAEGGRRGMLLYPTQGETT